MHLADVWNSTCYHHALQLLKLYYQFELLLVTKFISKLISADEI